MVMEVDGLSVRAFMCPILSLPKTVVKGTIRVT